MELIKRSQIGDLIKDEDQPNALRLRNARDTWISPSVRVQGTCTVLVPYLLRSTVGQAGTPIIIVWFPLRHRLCLYERNILYI